MTSYSLSHLSDDCLLRDLKVLVARDRTTTAALLAHLAEVDSRKLYLPAGYPSMHAWCVGHLGLCEQAALKRIHAARSARRFPSVFGAIADGRLHLSAVTLLAPHLTQANAGELLDGAAGKTKTEIQQILAERFPSSESLPMIEALPVWLPNRLSREKGDPPATGPLTGAAPTSPTAAPIPTVLAPSAKAQASSISESGELSPGKAVPTAPEQLKSAMRASRLAPIATERFALHLTFGKSAHDKLRYAQSLLGHQVPDGDLAAVLERVLDLAIGQLEKRKFGATHRPRPVRRFSQNARYIPRHVRRAVWERDGGRCTFVSSTGHRCEGRTRLEFDHVEPVARGGLATVEGVRLRCRAHNQHGAECAFGAEFMRNKRQEFREARKGRAKRAGAQSACEPAP